MSDQEARSGEVSATTAVDIFDEDLNIPTVGNSLDYVCDVRESDVTLRYFAMATKLACMVL